MYTLCTAECEGGGGSVVWYLVRVCWCDGEVVVCMHCALQSVRLVVARCGT